MGHITMTKQPRKGNIMSKSNRSVKKPAIIEEVGPSVVERVRPPKDEKGRYKEVDLSMEELDKLNLKTTSSRIRYLHSQGFSPSAIAKYLNIIYQHVRNVLNQQPKKATTTAMPTAAVEPTKEEEQEEDE